MKKYMSPEAQLLEFSATEEVCDVSATVHNGNMDKLTTNYDDGQDGI